LALYLDCAEDVPLREKVAVIEKKLVALEAEVRRVQTIFWCLPCEEQLIESPGAIILD